MLIRKQDDVLSANLKNSKKIKKGKELDMIYLCCKRLFLPLTDLSSSKTEQLFFSRLSNFSVSSDIQYLRCYSHLQLKSSIYDETVHHKILKPQEEDANPSARTVHFSSGKTHSFKKSL